MSGLWRGVVATIAGILAVGVTVALVLTVVRSPSRGETLIEVLKLFFAWPFMVALLGFAFGIAFRREIARFLENVGIVRFPGGTELHARQAPAGMKIEEEAVPAEDGVLKLRPEDQQAIQQAFQRLQQDLSEASQRAELSQQQTEEISQSLEAAGKLLEEEQHKTIFWWYQYLNLFLVLGTKLVLRWFSGLQIIPTKELFHEFWRASIPDTKERETILSVLLHYELIQTNGQQLWITEAGKSFLQFLDQQGLWPVPPVNTTDQD